MSTSKIIRAAQRLLQQLQSMAHSLTKRLIRRLLRGWLLIGRQPLFSRSGFVLPTTVLLLLVVTLTVGAIGFRTFTRTQQTIGERQQRVIYNAATPAIDRAKAKLEFLFDVKRDPRGGGVPSQLQLLGMMLNDSRTLPGNLKIPKHPSTIASGTDPYTIPANPSLKGDTGEKRIDINADGKVDNAWVYDADLDGDGAVGGPNDGKVAYSIIFTAPDKPSILRSPDITVRANNKEPSPFVRNSPLSNATQTSASCQVNTTDKNEVSLAITADGWFPDQVNRSKIRKNFQVDAYVLPNNPNGTVATLEFQQDREANQGLKWAAWFRNDLEIFPGPQFNWNGAMHTQGSLFVGGGSSDPKSFRGYLISSPASCIFDREASQISVADIAADTSNQIPKFQGQFAAALLKTDAFTTTPVFHLYKQNQVDQTPQLTATTDSVNQGSMKPSAISLDPVELQTNDVSKGRLVADPQTVRDDKWYDNSLNVLSGANGNDDGRLFYDNQETPYVDDLFRADDRYGPKPRFGRAGNRKKIDASQIGTPVTGTEDLAVLTDNSSENTVNVGLDGYWERRARREGMRLIVGQRLELGNLGGWGGPPATGVLTPDVRREPLKPWPGCTGSRCTNEARQRRALWDNLSAVQATAVYHAASTATATNRLDYPIACMATTVHPGTAATLDKSATFENLANFASVIAATTPLFSSGTYNYNTGTPIISDFLQGRGTNGWEFAVPAEDDFKTAGTPLRKALRNLANFAGDPKGGAPSFQVAQDSEVHPYPLMSMWGDFSMLRRVIQLMEENSYTYDKLSPADKTVLHTAGCMLGMLAYNLDYLEKFDYDAFGLQLENKTKTLPLAPAAGSPDDQLRQLIGYTTEELRTLSKTSPSDAEYQQGLRGSLRLILNFSDPTVKTLTSGLRRLPDEITNIPGFTPSFLRDLALNDQNNNDPMTFVRLMERWRDTSDTNMTLARRNELTRQIYLAQMIINKEQVARDRQLGFKSAGDSYADQPLGKCKAWYGIVSDPAKAPGTTIEQKIANSEPLFALCSRRSHYPILYSLFPAKQSNSSTIPVATVAVGYTNIDQPTGFNSHKDISNPLESDIAREDDGYNYYIASENAGVTYQVIRPQAIATPPLTLTRGGITLGYSGPGSGGSWKLLPATLPGGLTAIQTGTNAYSPNNSPTAAEKNRLDYIKICPANQPCSGVDYTRSGNVNKIPQQGTLVRVPFKDASFMNGREMLPVRALDVDIDLIRQLPIGDDYLLPKSGVVYAFREDATSEPAIVRPPRGGSSWSACKSDTFIRTRTNCQMQTAAGGVDAFRSADPPLNSDTGVSAKPVDYFADPDRRPHGFRLRDGASIWRTDSTKGITFVTDDPVYMQGNFNLHRAFGETSETKANSLEEFDVTKPNQRLDAATFTNFYTRNILDTANFARTDKDQWRPAEILADAVSILSSNFCDGSIEDGFIASGKPSSGTNDALPNSRVAQRYLCPTGSGSITSFLNQNRINESIALTTSDKNVRWVRSNWADIYRPVLRDWANTTIDKPNPDEGESPIVVSRLGNPYRAADRSEYSGTYYAFKDSKPKNDAVDGTQINMAMVSGIVPSRAGQSYGGLHNFPRFLENWSGDDLYISGSFLQLNFSSYAVAPFDQDVWEPTTGNSGEGDTGSELIQYYGAPDRRWGYDVALQYAAPGPVAERFKATVSTRSEFYTEPAADDPYIKNLCKQVKDANSCG